MFQYSVSYEKVEGTEIDVNYMQIQANNFVSIVVLPCCYSLKLWELFLFNFDSSSGLCASSG
jgi:hypothetical protein